MKTKIITALFLVAFLSTSTLVNGVPVDATNYKLDSTITIDGEMDDWADMSPTKVTLKPARVSAKDNASIQAEFYSTHDDTRIYFLIVVKDDPYHFYNYDTGLNHRYSPALAVSWPIDDGALAQFMGGTDRDTMDNIDKPTGKVDIMHWELDTLAGVVTGGTKNTTAGASFGNGVANLDDEWAETAEDRSDDNDQATSENSYLGSWSFTGGYTANGTNGDWIFEFSRDMQTGDIYDAQFAEGQTIDVAIAFWTPNERSNKKWTDDGHYVNYDNVIEMTISSETGPTKDDNPGFGLIIAFSSVFVLAAIIKKRK